jgi:hypothetical protein
MKREDDSQLWDLLGRMAEPKLSPFFARNVLRQIRQETRWLTRARPWIGLRGLIPASGLALAVIAAALLIHHPALQQKTGVIESDPVARIDAQDYEVVADLDELMASDENSLWDADSTL